MQVTLYHWRGREWFFIRAEGAPHRAIEDQTNDLFRRLDATLVQFELSLASTVRTRLWARERDSRDRGSAVRAATLTGAARSASSSFIASAWFESDASVGVELWALRPAPGATKAVVEYEPPIVPLRYLAWDSVIALSGVTAVLPTLQDQVRDILARIGETLEVAGVTWRDVIRTSCILHQSQSPGVLRSLLNEAGIDEEVGYDLQFADGYSTEGKLIEIEVTAQSQREHQR
jgi:enamine deaminase RidA (YjgF/YER057c/UK114 family)